MIMMIGNTYMELTSFKDSSRVGVYVCVYVYYMYTHI